MRGGRCWWLCVRCVCKVLGGKNGGSRCLVAKCKVRGYVLECVVVGGGYPGQTFFTKRPFPLAL